MLCHMGIKVNGIKEKMGYQEERRIHFWCEDQPLRYATLSAYKKWAWLLLMEEPFSCPEERNKKALRWSNLQVWRQMSCPGFFGHAAAVAGSVRLGALCLLARAEIPPLFLVCVSLHSPQLCVALSAGLCHCANSWSGLPELIIAFPWCTMPLGTVAALQNWHCDMEGLFSQ